MKIMREKMQDFTKPWHQSNEDKTFLTRKFCDYCHGGKSEMLHIEFDSKKKLRVENPYFIKDKLKEDLSERIMICEKKNLKVRRIRSANIHSLKIIAERFCSDTVSESKMIARTCKDGEDAEEQEEESEQAGREITQYPGPESGVQSFTSVDLEDDAIKKLDFQDSDSKTDLLPSSPPLKELSQKVEDALAKKMFGGIISVKDSMRIKFYTKIFNLNHILEQIDYYKDYGKKKKSAIIKQKRIIDKLRHKKVKQPTIHKKYFYINLIKPRKKVSTKHEINLPQYFEQFPPIETEKTEVEKPELEVKEEVSSEGEESEEVYQSLSCPSCTGSESNCCTCTAFCTCNEQARFQKFMFKVRERAEKRRKSYEVCNEEVVASSSSSSCCIVRPCHCGWRNCGCMEYRDYLKYKLFQVIARRRNRMRKREKLLEKLNEIIGLYYEEDEYNQKVIKFIDEFFVKPNGIANSFDKCCICGIYECKCETAVNNSNKSEKEEENLTSNHESIENLERSASDILVIPSTSSILRIPKYSSENIKTVETDQNDKNRPKLKFGSEDSNKFHSVEQKIKNSKSCVESMEIEDCIKIPGTNKKLCIVKKKEVEGRTRTGTNMMDIFQKSGSFLHHYIKDCDDDQTNEELTGLSEEFGGFNYKKFMIDVKCNCKNFNSYYEKKKKKRRAREKKYPLLKYLRKRICYLSQLEAAKKMMENTSSETDGPLSAPLLSVCEKYKLNGSRDERKKKFLRKKQRKVEKKVLFEIIKKGNHIHSCVCANIGEESEETCICEGECECFPDKIHAKQKKTKVEPSIGIDHLLGIECILGNEGTFPPCPECSIKLGVASHEEVDPIVTKVADLPTENETEESTIKTEVVQENQDMNYKENTTPEIGVPVENEVATKRVPVNKQKKMSIKKGQENKSFGGTNKHTHFQEVTKGNKSIGDKISKKVTSLHTVRGSKARRGSKTKPGKHEGDAAKKQTKTRSSGTKKQEPRKSKKNFGDRPKGVGGKGVPEENDSNINTKEGMNENCPEISEMSCPPAVDAEVSIFSPGVAFNFAWL